MLLKTLLFGSILVPYSVSAGPVSSSQGFPFASVNSEGCLLAVGDLKTWIKWDINSERVTLPPRYSATFLKKKERQDPELPERFTGGIASSKAPTQITAIACSEVDSQIFISQRNQSYPAGEWAPWNFSSDLRYCSMLPTGTFALLYPSLKKLVIQKDGDTTSLDISDLRGKRMELVSGKELFMILTDSGLAQVCL